MQAAMLRPFWAILLSTFWGVGAVIAQLPTDTSGKELGLYDISRAGGGAIQHICTPPDISAVTNKLFCSGVAVSSIPFNSSSPGAVFTWTNSDVAIGLPASGTGALPAFTASNPVNIPITATITVTPSVTIGGVPCTGTPMTFTITVNPSPTVNPISNQILCDRDNTAAVFFGSPVTGTTFSWTNTTTSIGLAASGNGTIFSFNAINTTPVPVIATVSVTPRFTSGGLGCTGTPRSFTIQVNPKPNVVLPTDQSVCNGLPTSTIVINGFVAGTVFNWTNSNTSIGLPASGTGNIASFIATNPTTVPIVASITITPSNTIAGVTCTGFPRSFNIIVHPTPAASLATPPSTFICEGSSVTLSASGGATYQWYLNGGLIPGVNTATFDAVQPGTYTVVPTSAFGCRGTISNPITLTLISRPQPDFSFDKYCAGFPTQFVNLSQVNGSGIVGYAWAFGEGGVSTQINPTYTYTQPGTFNATLIATPVLCPSLATPITKPVTIIAPPANIRYPTVNAVASRDLTLQARTFTGAAYQWAPPAGLNNPLAQYPVFNFNQEQQYRIRIVTAEGCVLNDSLLVRIFPEREIYVAGGFTPNGDGKNDLIIPKLVGIKSLRYFKVYDRWGQLIYQTNIEGQGWDGKFKGVPQPLETYIWIAEGIDLEDKIVKRSGDFILFR
jgi:gliding motility-associated-like protein